MSSTATATDPPAFDEAWFSARAATRRARPAARTTRATIWSRCGAASATSCWNWVPTRIPTAPSPAARAAILDQLHALHRYPDPLGLDLKRALAAHHGVDPSQILLGNGSHELLMQFAQVFAGAGEGRHRDEVVYSRYGFAVFALASAVRRRDPARRTRRCRARTRRCRAATTSTRWPRPSRRRPGWCIWPIRTIPPAPGSTAGRCDRFLARGAAAGARGGRRGLRRDGADAPDYASALSRLRGTTATWS